MPSASFRDILRQMLEAEEAALGQKPAATTKVAAESAPPLDSQVHWRAPEFQGKPSNRSYPRSTSKAKSAAAKVEKRERLFAFSELGKAEQSDIQLLIVLGADFRSGISKTLLKKEHRRLVKGLHPDRAEKGLSLSAMDLRREQFLVVQAAYERLNDALELKSASDNESASAANYPRQDAA